jgi:N-methylhydantoinase A
MQSNGGVISAERAAERPIRTLESGPAGGVIGCLALARELGTRTSSARSRRRRTTLR